MLLLWQVGADAVVVKDTPDLMKLRALHACLDSVLQSKYVCVVVCLTMHGVERLHLHCVHFHAATPDADIAVISATPVAKAAESKAEAEAEAKITAVTTSKPVSIIAPTAPVVMKSSPVSEPISLVQEMQLVANRKQFKKLNENHDDIMATFRRMRDLETPSTTALVQEYLKELSVGKGIFFLLQILILFFV